MSCTGTRNQARSRKDGQSGNKLCRACARKMGQQTRDQEELLTLLSHEVLTPLTCIIGWTRLAQEQPNPEATRQALEIIDRNARRQQRLVNDLITYSRLTQGIISLELQPVDLWKAAVRQIEAFTDSARERKITIALRPLSDALPVIADPERIGEVIAHLLRNAVKYTEPGGTITLMGGQRRKHVFLSIRNTGDGIPTDFLPEIFEPFRPAHRDTGGGGLGLGLTLARGLVKLHHGRIRAANQHSDHHTAFTISLPLREENR